MNAKKIFSQINTFRFVPVIVALATLTGCVGRWDGPRAEVEVAPPVVEAGFAVQDDYVYYPNYECYYSVSRHQYAYREGNEWVSRPAPRGVSVAMLTASPSVKMDFHDSPAQHHAAVVKQYPKNWKPAGSNQDQNKKDDKHNDHGNDQGK